MGVEDRRHFRIKYPPNERPRLVVEDQALPVVDLSESGLKFVGNPAFKPKIKQDIQGVLVFGDDSRENIHGHVVRIVGDMFMIAFKKMITKARLAREADRLLSRYGQVPTADPHK